MQTKKRRRRKCKNCQSLYKPDCRNLRHQEYCPEPECKKASKAQSQKKWLNKTENKDYFKNPDNVRRVQPWREKNPGYSKLSASPPKDLSHTQGIKGESAKIASGAHGSTSQEILINSPLQDPLPLQAIDIHSEKEKYGDSDPNPLKIQPLQDVLSAQTLDTSSLEGDIKKMPLQEVLNAQSPVIVGLTASLTGTALQDVIAKTIWQLTLLGKEILNRATPIRGD